MSPNRRHNSLFAHLQSFITQELGQNDLRAKYPSSFYRRFSSLSPAFPRLPLPSFNSQLFPPLHVFSICFFPSLCPLSVYRSVPTRPRPSTILIISFIRSTQYGGLTSLFSCSKCLEVFIWCRLNGNAIWRRWRASAAPLRLLFLAYSRRDGRPLQLLDHVIQFLCIGASVYRRLLE